MGESGGACAPPLASRNLHGIGFDFRDVHVTQLPFGHHGGDNLTEPPCIGFAVVGLVLLQHPPLPARTGVFPYFVGLSCGASLRAQVFHTAFPFSASGLLAR